ncbi:hypothetical protein ACPT8I_15640 [Lactiplantibacillus plantarum]|uniref:hypothetical protein n=1 Tax=Lactiplantibacillus plantarum TaxID=1590 RepID=UPI002572DE0B|nr:hypothetical protein [Lactiplantibacillus plantarum]BEI46528.1 hypothetical protein IYO2065_10320 [Lactiplantibacillus plantarum]
MGFHNNFVHLVGNAPQGDGSTKVTTELDDGLFSVKVKDNKVYDPEAIPKDSSDNKVSDPEAIPKDSSDNKVSDPEATSKDSSDNKVSDPEATSKDSSDNE